MGFSPKLDARKVYRARVSKVDADGNEVAGIRLPDIAAPLATYTGWNFYKAPFTEGELCDRDGSYLALPATRAEREKSADPRRSLEERYGSHGNYVKAVEDAGDALVKARLLLPDDARAFVEKAKGEEARKLFPRP